MIEMIIVKADILAFYMLTDRRRLLLEPLRIGTYLAKLCLANQDHRMQSMSQHVVDLHPPTNFAVAFRSRTTRSRLHAPNTTFSPVFITLFFRS